MPPPARSELRQALRNGWRKRCPRCGKGPLFVRMLRTHDRCSNCGLVFQRDHGDTWMFMIITDRIPILFGIAAVYFGFHPQGTLQVVSFFGALAIPVVATMQQRQGLAIALDYYVSPKG